MKEIVIGALDKPEIFIVNEESEMVHIRYKDPNPKDGKPLEARPMTMSRGVWSALASLCTEDNQEGRLGNTFGTKGDIVLRLSRQA
jgi:hypothetical protein